MQNMEGRFYVIDAQGNVSHSAKKNAPEHFKTRAAAIERARELARSEPGHAVYVAETAEVLMREISEPKRVGTSLSETPGVLASTAALLSLFPADVELDANTSFVTAGRDNAGDGGGAVFRYDADDTTTTDNGGTVRVDVYGGRRWKMVAMNALPASYADGTVFENKLDFTALIVEIKGLVVATQIQAGTYTDDLSEVMQEAQDRVAAVGGGVVHMGPGTYYMANITAKTGVTVEGAGWGYTPSNPSYQTTIRANAAGNIFTIGNGSNAIHGVRFRYLNFIGLGTNTAVRGLEFKTGSGWNGAEHCSFWSFDDQAITSKGDNRFESIFAVGCVLNRTRTEAIGVVELAKDDNIVNSELGASMDALSPNFSVTVGDAPVCISALYVAGADVNVSNCILEWADVPLLINARDDGSSRASRIIDVTIGDPLAHGVVVDGDGATLLGVAVDTQALLADNMYDAVFITARARANTISAISATGAASGNKFRYVVNDNFPGSVSGYNIISDIRADAVSGAPLKVATTYLGARVDGRRHTYLPTGAEPSVNYDCFFEDRNETATNITNLLDGYSGQRVSILCSGNSTFVYNNTKIYPASAANVTPAADTVISFICHNGVWYED